MKHLFIVNPAVDKIRGRIAAVVGEIDGFFSQNPDINYETHVTRWARDAVGFVRRYVSCADEIVRVHVFGGSGTLFEAVNGVIGLPNVQIAAYPMGRSNYFLRYFGDDKLHLFDSLRNQVFFGATSIDALRCGTNFGISHGLVGVEAISGKDGTEMIEKTRLPIDFCYVYSVAKNLLNQNAGQRYNITLDGNCLDGDYLSMMIANGPCYGKSMSPAVDAHPNDGLFNVYLAKDMPRLKRLTTVPTYASGNYLKLPERILHHTGSKIAISSDTTMCISVDGETFYENTIEYEVIPYAIDFVCPPGVDLSKIPRIRNLPSTTPRV